MAFNTSKIVEELGEFFYAWRFPPPAHHWGGAWPNRFVEAARVSPYAIGHIDCVVWPLFIVLLVREFV